MSRELGKGLGALIRQTTDKDPEKEKREDPPDDLQSKDEINAYRSSVEKSMKNGRISEDEKLVLWTLGSSMGISKEDQQSIMDSVRADFKPREVGPYTLAREKAGLNELGEPVSLDKELTRLKRQEAFLKTQVQQLEDAKKGLEEKNFDMRRELLTSQGKIKMLENDIETWKDVTLRLKQTLEVLKAKQDIRPPSG